MNTEQRGHGSSRESRGERCEDRKGFPRWGKSLSFVGTYLCQGHATSRNLKKIEGTSEFYCYLDSGNIGVYYYCNEEEKDITCKIL